MNRLDSIARVVLFAVICLAASLIAAPIALAQDVATIHYHRPDGAYADWGLHVWGDAAQETEWTAPLPPTGEDEFGLFWEVALKPDAKELGFIVHKGEQKDPGPDMALDLTQSKQAWVISRTPQLYTEPVNPADVTTAAPNEPEPAPPSPINPAVSFPGNYGQAIGAPSWEPDDPAVQGSDDDGDGVWTLGVILQQGDYEFKVAIDGDWAENYGLNGEPGGANIPFSVAQEGEMIFSFARANNAIGVSVDGKPVVENGAAVALEPPSALGDGLFARAAILHDSRSDLYRNPGGAQPLDSAITLRLRTAADDVGSVTLLLDNLGSDFLRKFAMDKVASADGFDWWQTTIDTGDEVTAYSYSFHLRDGEETRYYADDSARDGGSGQLSQTQPSSDQGWNIYAYAPGFESPEWAQNAIIYQIFPDRFRNGEPANDQTTDDWFYPDERGHAFPVTPWNTIVPDPMPADPAENPQWYGTWSNTFYGGDLQGVVEKLDELQALGVTTIYFNPIFDSPSNHRYDGRDYRVVDDSLAIAGDAAASMALFDSFAAEIERRGMHLILDGVPNHTSSDSPQFDRFDRHETDGACEAEDSPYRSWYFFDPARPPGSGDCAGDADYRGWAGVSTLPQANTANQQVIDNWLGEEGIVRQWLSKPGVDGWRIDVVPDVVQVNPTFFEQMRSAAKEANPDALLISETWGERDARMRLLGDEFDSTMNYRFRLALLGFLRDRDFSEDGDGGVPALTASEFEAALRAIQEDYPPAAFASAMNLLSSHDVNRAVRVLDHDGIDYQAQQPVNDFVDGRKRLALAAALQLTLPGAPTIYYGDEVGLVGFGSDIPRDDPYNRQPYPWPDADGYDNLPDWRKQDADLLAHYQKLGQLRNRHTFLRTGSWDSLLIDDAGVIVYGRKDASGAALVTLNRSAVTQTVSINVAGYLPFGAVLNDPFGDATLTIGDGSSGDAGAISFTVPAMSYQLWLTDDEIDLTTPVAPTVTVTEGDGFVDLNITPVPDAIQYAVYRSFVDGGYQEMFVTGGAGPSFVASDADLRNGAPHFYRVAAVAANGLRSPLSEPLVAVPHAQIASVALVEPLVLSHTLSAITPTASVQGLVLIPGQSEAEGATPGVIAQLGFAPSAGADFAWRTGAYASELDGGDLYTATMTPDASGEFVYRWRASNSDGREWVESTTQGALTVAPSADTVAPKPPFRLDEIARSASSITLAWRLSRSPDLFGFRICRADLTAGEQGCAQQFSAPKATNVYTDVTVITGHTYSYTVQTVDTSFNASLPSKPITLTADLALVKVTWRVRVPAETPPADEVFIAGDSGDVFGAAYNPGLTPMSAAGDGLWEWSAVVEEGKTLQYKYTRGNWETVEQWGTISGLANRQLTVVKEADGAMLVDDTATDWGAEGADDHRAVQSWRDPLVTATEPAPDSSGAVERVQVTFSILVSASDPAQVIRVVDDAGAPVAGRVTGDGGDAFVFTPDAPLAAGGYTATAFNVESTTPMVAPFIWGFTVE